MHTHFELHDVDGTAKGFTPVRPTFPSFHFQLGSLVDSGQRRLHTEQDDGTLSSFSLLFNTLSSRKLYVCVSAWCALLPSTGEGKFHFSLGCPTSTHCSCWASRHRTSHFSSLATDYSDDGNANWDGARRLTLEALVLLRVI